MDEFFAMIAVFAVFILMIIGAAFGFGSCVQQSIEGQGL